MIVIIAIILRKPSNDNSSITHTINVALHIQYAIVTAVWALQFGRHALLHTDILCHWILPSSSFSHHAVECIILRDTVGTKPGPSAHGKSQKVKIILCCPFPQKPDVWVTILINPQNSNCAEGVWREQRRRAGAIASEHCEGVNIKMPCQGYDIKRAIQYKMNQARSVCVYFSRQTHTGFKSNAKHQRA